MTLGASDSFSKLPQLDPSAASKPRQQSSVSFSSNYSLPSISTKFNEPIKEDIDGALWLTELGLEQYIETFLTNLSSDGRIVLRRRLKQIRQQDLSKMNILDFDDQKFIMEHIRLILKHPFHSMLHRKESKLINSPAKRSPQKKVVKTIEVEPEPQVATASTVSEAKTSDSASAEHKKSAEHIPIAKDVKTLQKEKAKANRRRRSFDNSVWQSISSLRTKEKQGAMAAAQLREGNFENLSPHHTEPKNDGNNSKKNAGRRRWSFNNEDGNPVRNIHDKATAYGNFALEFDMLQSSLKALEHEYLDKFCNMLNCEKASIFFINEDSGDLLLFADNRTWYRIPKGSGLVGFCAETGQSLNVPDAYQDYRFNQNMDKKTGFRTRSVLCQPVRRTRGGGSIVAVIEMINKKGGEEFGADDEDVLSTCVQRIADVLSDQFSHLQNCAKKFSAGAIYVGTKGASAITEVTPSYEHDTVGSQLRAHDKNRYLEEMLNRELKTEGKK